MHVMLRCLLIYSDVMILLYHFGERGVVTL